MNSGVDMFGAFRGLLSFGSDIGRVESAHMYDESMCTVEGVGKGGHKFTLSFRVEPICEKNNEEEKRNDEE